jgi:hypothetical protein
MSEWAPTEEELFGPEWLEREKRREQGEEVLEPLDGDEPTFNGAVRHPNGRFWVLPERKYRTDGRREIFSRTYEHLLATIMAQARRSDTVEPVLALHAVKAMRRLCDELEYEAVAIARGCGWSWNDVGAALGLSASGAHRQFARESAEPRKRRPSGETS